jgi:hypothetical protein
MRGAILYDLFMAQRFERDAATEAGVWTLLTRLASDYRAEDERERAGRRSWRTIRAVLAARPSLLAMHGRIR